MSKRLTNEQLCERLSEIESRYYKGHRQTEEWWRVTGNVHPIDRRRWTMYTGLLNQRTVEAIKLIEGVK
jgi:hypothetical protein